MSGINSYCRVFLWLNATQHTRQMESFHWRIGFVQSTLHTLRKCQSAPKKPWGYCSNHYLLQDQHIIPIINDDNVVFNVKTFEDLIAYQEKELQGNHSIGSPTLNLEYDDGVDNKNNSTSKLINFNLGTSDKKRRNITTNKSLEISSSNDSDDETNNISEESLKEGMLKRSNNQRNTSLKRNAKMTLSSVDASSITEEVSVILEDNGNVHNADYYSNSFQSDDIVDEQNVSHQDVGVQTTNDCLSWRECIPPGLLEDRRPIIEG
uniref:Uncharacterized protein n=1 Tax=Timema cristinae TaxID=61476 RepID=A0A7R9D2U8_TIMCR|nr:unnamed protein product [Timema cristinae]